MSITEFRIINNLSNPPNAVVKYIGENSVWGHQYVGSQIVIPYYDEERDYHLELNGMLVDYSCDAINGYLFEEVLKLAFAVIVYMRPAQIPMLMIKRDKMDIDYPHICYGCGDPLKWIHLRTRNLKADHSNKKELKKLWKSARVEFYCCNCYANQKIENHNNYPYEEFYTMYLIEVNIDIFNTLYERYKQMFLFQLSSNERVLNSNERHYVYTKIYNHLNPIKNSL